MSNYFTIAKRPDGTKWEKVTMIDKGFHYEVIFDNDIGFKRVYREEECKFKPMKKEVDIKIGSIEKKYGVDFNVRNDMKLGTYLKEKGLPSLSKVLNKITKRKIKPMKKENWEKELEEFNKHFYCGDGEEGISKQRIIHDLKWAIENDLDETVIRFKIKFLIRKYEGIKKCKD